MRFHVLVNTFSNDENQSQLRPKIQIIIQRAEMMVKSLRTSWRSEILSNRADIFYYSLVGV
jgi:hypothetical protein